MSRAELETVGASVRQLMKEDERLETRENCAEAAEIIYQYVSRQNPHLHAHILTYPHPKTHEPLHVAVGINDTEGNSYIINPVAAALFPQFLGFAEDAVETFSHMEPLTP